MKIRDFLFLIACIAVTGIGIFIFGKNSAKETPPVWDAPQYERTVGQAAPGLSLWRVQVIWERSWSFPGLDAVGPLQYLVYAKGVPTLKDVEQLGPPLSGGSGRWKPVRIVSVELVNRVQPAPEKPEK